MRLMTRHDHRAAKWELIGDTGRIRVGVYPDGTARLSIRPTREFKKLSAESQKNPWVVFHTGTPKECRAMAEKLQTVFMHAVLWVESGRGDAEFSQ
jgi:hypothetical protein